MSKNIFKPHFRERIYKLNSYASKIKSAYIYMNINQLTYLSWTNFMLKDFSQNQNLIYKFSQNFYLSNWQGEKYFFTIF